MSVATQAFATQGEIATIDVLPLDLQLWAQPGYNVDLARVRDGAEVNLMSVALDTLARRNYALGAVIDWNGNFPGGSALSHDELVATVSALSRYGAVAAEHPGQLPVPYLPARLGATTGADATLYVGGWGYVAEPRDSTGDKVAQGILIGLLIISVVAIIAIVASKSHGGGRGGGHSSGRGGSGGGGGRGGHSVGGAGGVGGHGAGGGGGGGVAHGAFTASRGAHHIHGARRAAEGVIDAFGRAAVDIAISSPDWGENPALPHEGGESQMYLEMTLVDNRTGLALWHAHQSFPASAADASETVRAARTMMNQLPARAGRPQTAAR